MKRDLTGKRNTGFQGKPGGDNRGSSLIEVIVSVLMLAIIVVPMLNMFVTSNRINNKAKLQQYATASLENIMEEIKAGQHQSNEVINGIRQGTRTFRAEVLWTTTSSLEELNRYQMPEISTFDSDYSTIIYVDTIEYDETIHDYFYDFHMYQVELLNEEALQEDYEAYLSEIEELPPEEVIPYDPVARAVPTITPMPQEEYEQRISRTTIVHFFADAEGCYVTSSLLYKVTPQPGDLAMPEDDSASYELQFFTGSRFATEDLKSLYLMYIPYTSDGAREELILDASRIAGAPDAADFDCRVLLAVQEPVISMAALPVTVIKDLSTELEVCCDTAISSIWKQNESDVGSPYAYTSSLVPKVSAGDVIYNVNVKVYQEGGTDVLAEADTVLYK